MCPNLPVTEGTVSKVNKFCCSLLLGGHIETRSLLESLLFSTFLVMNFQDTSWDANHFQREACVPKQDFKFPSVKGRKSGHKLL